MKNTPWKIEWSDALSMSNPEIDAEHKHFIALVNELNGAIIDRREKAEVVHILDLLLEDAVAHFAHEERLFIEKGYPKAEEHKRLHAGLVDVFRQALENIRRTEFSRIWIEMGLDIKNRLVDHLLNEDTQYIEYLRTE